MHKKLRWRLAYLFIFVLNGLMWIVFSIIGLFLIYITSCWIQWDKLPSEFSLTTPDIVERGGEFPVCFQNQVRFKDFTFQRDIYVVDSKRRRIDFTEVNSEDVKKGRIDDICVSLKIDKTLEAGLATFVMTIRYYRPGNLLDYLVYPVKRTIVRNFFISPVIAKEPE